MKELNISVLILNISDFNLSEMSKSNNYIFLISTHFDGDSCDDGNFVYNFMKKQKAMENLKGIKFTVYGLGDITFRKFNTPAVRYWEQFIKWGMIEFFPW